MQTVADATFLGWRTIWRAEQGHDLRPESKRLICEYFGMSAEELGLSKPAEPATSAPSGTAAVLEEAIGTLENEGVDMHSRRSFLQLIGAVGAGVAGATLPAHIPAAAPPRVNVSNSVIASLVTMTEQFRTLQRAGYAVEPSLKDQVVMIQRSLENTLDEGHRRELWRLLAQSQLLARHSITSKAELGRARTYNEAAIAAAQYSGDALLLGASLGHLGHLYLIWLDDCDGALELLTQAQSYTKGHPVSGWLAMVGAAVTAKEGRKKECEAAINQALETAYGLPQTDEQTDLYYTDFNVVGTNAYAGNSLLKVGKPAQALERLLAVDMEKLSKNRHASALYDIAGAYIAMGELEAAQPYALRSIDCACETKRTYIIPRFMNLAHKIQQQDTYSAHAATITEYAYNALAKEGIVA
jgi:tetratricopeptide (TPR) repeat protein